MKSPLINRAVYQIFLYISKILEIPKNVLYKKFYDKNSSNDIKTIEKKNFFVSF